MSALDEDDEEDDDEDDEVLEPVEPDEAPPTELPPVEAPLDDEPDEPEDPEEPDEPDEPEDDEEPEPVTSWPTVRLTAATLPVMLERRVASARSVSAVVRADWADVTADWSESIWLVEAESDLSLDSLAWSADRVAVAASTSSRRAELPTVARDWPALTFWPTLTWTAVTWPDTAKSRSAWWPGSMVPDADTVCFMVPVVADTTSVVVVIGAAEEVEDPLVPSHTPTPAPARTTTIPPAKAARRRRRRPRPRRQVPSSATGTSPVGSSAGADGRSVPGLAMAVSQQVQPGGFLEIGSTPRD